LSALDATRERLADAVPGEQRGRLAEAGECYRHVEGAAAGVGAEAAVRVGRQEIDDRFAEHGQHAAPVVVSAVSSFPLRRTGIGSLRPPVKRPSRS
jgi:hypothetical protein